MTYQTMLTVVFSALLLTACGGKSKSKKTVIFDVELTNVTANQPFAPAAVVLHGAGYSGWQIGEPASAGLEMLAESGMPGDFLAEAAMVKGKAGLMTSAAADGVLMPGDSVHFELEAKYVSSVMLTVASMPVNTNDGYSGVTGVPLMTLMEGDTLKRLLPIYDAGTEFNSEMASHIPGPAGGGEGYNSERNDVNYVAYHPGVITGSDGYMQSTLDATHKFDQGGLLLSITRRR